MNPLPINATRNLGFAMTHTLNERWRLGNRATTQRVLDSPLSTGESAPLERPPGRLSA
jgi:hypothetical protein